MVFKAMLDLLDENKRLPNYAAERRIDLFINLFLEKILTAYYGEKVNFVVPEFPLKHESNNQADKLDYLCAFDKTKQPIFVELKTDVISFSNKQASFYVKQAASWPVCIEGLKAIIGNKKMRFSYRGKYFQLVERLLGAGLADLPDEGAGESVQRLTALVTSLNTPREKGEFSRALLKLSRHIHARWSSEAKLLYLVPHDDNVRKQIERTCGDKVSLLDFAEIENLPIDFGMNYAIEFRQLVEFLKNLK